MGKRGFSLSQRMFRCIVVASLWSANPGAWAQVTQLDEVVVSAQKREQLAQDVPLTVTTIDADTLEQSQVKDLFQAANFVSGMVFSRAPDDGLALTLRGVGTPARSQAFEQSVGLFTDGIFLAKGRLYPLAFFDLARIEVIKGTDGTLLGKNTSLGAISLVPNAPGSKLSLDLRAGDELYDGGVSLDAAADLPADPIYFRMAGHYSDTNGWVRNLATGRDVPNDRDVGLRTIAATASDQPFAVKLFLQLNDDRRLGVPFQIVDPQLPPALGEGLLNDTESEFTTRTRSGDSEHHTRATLTGLEFEWRLPSGVSLVSHTAHVAYRLQMDDDFDFSVEPWIDFVRSETYHQLTQEFRIVSPAGQRIEYLAGAYWLHSDWHSIEQQLWGVPAFPPPPSPISGQLFNGPFTNDFTEATSSFAQFGQLTWRIAAPVALSVGVRHTLETKDTLYGRTNASPLTIWNVAANPPFPPTRLPFGDSFVDGNASLQWEPNRDLHLYAAYGRGTKTGGYVESNSVAYPIPADPAVDSIIKSETTHTVELGLKTLLAERSMRLNVAVFDTHISNFQDTVFTGSVAGFITENLPLSSKGVDLEAAWQATPRLRLAAATTYADAKERLTAEDFALVPDINCQPCRPAQSPAWTANFAVDYLHTLMHNWNWHANMQVRYRDAMFNQRGDVYPSGVYAPIDAVLELISPGGTVSIALSGQNLNNSLSEDFASPSVAPTFAGLASPAPLRTVWLTGRLHL